ncbi:MAG: sulfite exporter TauE/SafE family protein [Acidobacteria bacterium]|nr:sulfite exporter TauE/SafE family protein [Acidobacteriota bacterium]
MLAVTTAVQADAGLVTILALSFGTGLIHALDADHVAAVSALASRGIRWSKVMRVSCAWAVGHGATLLAVGIAVYVVGIAIPEDLAGLAERSVGLILLAVGISVLFQLARRGVHLHTHSHDDLPAHAHLHTHNDPVHHDEDHRHEHRAVLVGSVHGLAGSAPLLALIPLSQVGSPAAGMAYLGVFCLGVFFAMAVFGGLFGGLLGWGSRSSRWLLSGVQIVTGTVSAVLGGWLLLGG